MHSFCVGLLFASASSSSCFTPSRDVACTLEDCLDAFTEEEELIGDEKYLCTVCKCHQPATKWLKIHHYPKILVLHLKRFSWTGMMSRSKINTIVSTTQHNLDLTNYRADTCTTVCIVLFADKFGISTLICASLDAMACFFQPIYFTRV